MDAEKLLNDLSRTTGTKSVQKAIDIITEKFIIPKLEAWADKPKDYFEIQDMIKNYLQLRYDEDVYMNTIVFQKETKTIYDLYIPLTLTSHNNKSERIKYFIDDKFDIFEKLDKLLIVDTAGMGKSTLVKYMSLQTIKNGYSVPFVIELRLIKIEESILDYLLNKMKICDEKFRKADIKDILRRGDFIFFFDGFDEVSDERKGEVSEKVKSFINSSTNNKFVLTSREDDYLSNFGDFEKYSIQGLSKEEAYELIRKYDLDGETSKELIRTIEEEKHYKMIEEFLKNPLMVSLLYLTFQYKGIIHYKKHIFYRQVYDALFEKHDSMKGSGKIHYKRCLLDIDDFNKLLSAIGFLSVKKGKTQFDRNEIIIIINEALDIIKPTSCKASHFLYDIVHTVPLFMEDGPYIKWIHKSFSEYFAAYFICFEQKNNTEKIIEKIMRLENNSRYFNVLDFCYDMDQRVSELLIYSICSSFIEYYNNSYVDDMFSSYNKDDIECRKGFCFLNTIKLAKVNLKGLVNENDLHVTFQRAKNAFNDDKFSYLTLLSKKYGIFEHILRKPFFEIAKLLFIKKVDIFKQYNGDECSEKMLKKIKELVYEIDDNKDNTINSSDLFKVSTNLILCHEHELNFKVLDIDKCIKMLHDIDNTRKKSIDIFDFN